MATDPTASGAKRCAYCGTSSASLTREHVFPAALDTEFRSDATSPMKQPYWVDRLDEKMIGGAPVVKDVCGHCNNVILSSLDAYGTGLFRRYFHRIAERGDRVVFDYDYDRLLRWVLKLNYNSARANQADDLAHLYRLRSYIIGQKRRPKRAALFLSLAYRHAIPDETKAHAATKGVAITNSYEPDMLRIGHFAINTPGWNPLVSRTAVFQSFVFAILIVSDREPASELERLKRMFSNLWPSGACLSPSTGTVTLRASVAAQDTFQTHAWKNMSYYSRKYPKLFS